MPEYEVPWTMDVQYYRKDGWADPSKHWSGKFTGIVFYYDSMAKMACAMAGNQIAMRNVVYDWQKFQYDTRHIANMKRDLFSDPNAKSAEHRLDVCEGGWVIFKVTRDDA